MHSALSSTLISIVEGILIWNKTVYRHARALISGACASMVGQTCIVPCDVISQHMMIVGMHQSKTGEGYVLQPYISI